MNPAPAERSSSRGPLAWAAGAIGGAVLGTALLGGWPGAAVGFLVGGLLGWLG